MRNQRKSQKRSLWYLFLLHCKNWSTSVSHWTQQVLIRLAGSHFCGFPVQLTTALCSGLMWLTALHTVGSWSGFLFYFLWLSPVIDKDFCPGLLWLTGRLTLGFRSGILVLLSVAFQCSLPRLSTLACTGLLVCLMLVSNQACCFPFL